MIEFFSRFFLVEISETFLARKFISIATKNGKKPGQRRKKFPASRKRSFLRDFSGIELLQELAAPAVPSNVMKIGFLKDCGRMTEP